MRQRLHLSDVKGVGWGVGGVAKAGQCPAGEGRGETMERKEGGGGQCGVEPLLVRSRHFGLADVTVRD